MSTKSGTIDLSVTRIISGISRLDGVSSIMLNSSDLSASTDILLEGSIDGITWASMKESGVVITDTLVSATPNLISIKSDEGLRIRIRFDGSTTGNVSYTHNLL